VRSRETGACIHATRHILRCAERRRAQDVAWRRVPGPFQGADAPASIRNAMLAVHAAHQEEAYDALAIIRGGGSMADLAWLNDMKLALWACRIPIPGLSGIGHERDSTILDENPARRYVYTRSSDSAQDCPKSHISQGFLANALQRSQSLST
jgi:exonuclease VII large subunit